MRPVGVRRLELDRGGWPGGFAAPGRRYARAARVESVGSGAGCQANGRSCVTGVTLARKRSQFAQTAPEADHAGLPRPPRLRHRRLRGDPAAASPRASSAPTFRLHRPARELAFSKQDRAAPGFERAVRGGARGRVRAGRPARRRPRRRLSRGHAGVRLGDARPSARSPAPASASSWLAEIVAAALRGLGVDARVGEVPGEYCPGAWSVNAARADQARRDRPAADRRRRPRRRRARRQRTRSCCARRSSPSYAALELDWDPATAGSVEDEVAGDDARRVEEAIVAELGARLRARRRRARPGDAGARRRARGRPRGVAMISADGGDDDHDARPSRWTPRRPRSRRSPRSSSSSTSSSSSPSPR